MMNSKLQKLYRSFQTAILIWVTMAFLLGAVAPAAASGIMDDFSVPSANAGGFEEAIKALAEQPLTSTPLRLRRLTVETLRPVSSEQGGPNTLPLAIVNRIIEDNSVYFFDEGRITHAVVISHDRGVVQRLIALLKDKRVSPQAKQVRSCTAA